MNIKMLWGPKFSLFGPEDGGGSGGGGAPSAPSGYPSGSGGGGEKIGSPQAIFGDAPVPPSQGASLTPPPSTTRSGITAPPPEEPPVQPPARQTQQPQPPAQTQQPQSGQPPQSPADRGTVAMTEEQLAALAATITKAAQTAAPAPQQPPQPLRPMTPEEQAQFDREFNVVRVTPEIFQGIMGFAPEKPEQLKALENFAHSIMRMSASMTMYQMNNTIKAREEAVRAEFTPIQAHYQQQQSQQLQQTFFERHPDLKGSDALIVEITKAAKADGLKFKSSDEIIEFVANRARTLLGKGAPSSSTQGQQPQGQRPAMPTTSMGGRSGGQGSPQQSAVGPRSVFGDLDRQ